MAHLLTLNGRPEIFGSTSQETKYDEKKLKNPKRRSRLRNVAIFSSENIKDFQNFYSIMLMIKKWAWQRNRTVCLVYCFRLVLEELFFLVKRRATVQTYLKTPKTLLDAYILVSVPPYYALSQFPALRSLNVIITSLTFFHLFSCCEIN